MTTDQEIKSDAALSRRDLEDELESQMQQAAIDLDPEKPTGMPRWCWDGGGK